MLKIDKLNAFYGKIQVLYDISMEIHEGDIVSVVGSNGAGKTSLLRSVTGLLKEKNGDISFLAESIAALEPHKIVERRIVLVPEGRKIFCNMTTFENLILGSYLALPKTQRKENIEYVLQLFPVLKERRNQYTGSLSGGEQQMVAIGRALMASPKLLLLDEPSLGLAPLIVDNIFESIEMINGAKTTILLVEQNVYKVLRISTRAWVLENGKMVLEGSGKDLLQNPYLRKAYLGI